jgi:hypothetical protein
MVQLSSCPDFEATLHGSQVRRGDQISNGEVIARRESTSPRGKIHRRVFHRRGSLVTKKQPERVIVHHRSLFCGDCSGGGREGRARNGMFVSVQHLESISCGSRTGTHYGIGEAPH